MRSFVVFAILFACANVFAAPYNGEEHEFTQPDGSVVTVLLYGDELHIDAESPDGYTLIQDKDGWIYYAKLSEDGSEYVSTGVRYTKNSASPVLQKKSRINKNSLQNKRSKNRKALGAPEDGELYYNPPKKPGKNNGSPQSAPPEESFIQPAPGDITHMKGITLVINFPEADGSNAINAAASREHVDSVFNHPKFRGGQGSSVYDWYNDVSNGKMQYKNTVVPYVTADRGKSFYDDGCSENYKQVQPLVHSALKKLKTEVEAGRASLGQPSTVKQSNVNSNNPTVLALNIYFAGSSGCGWAKGIWPHQGWYRGVSGETKVTITEGGSTYHFYWYQMSAMGTSNNIVSSVNTVVHENGHMIMGWSDLYNYDSNNGNVNVVGQYCVMSSGTAMPNPYFRDEAGWIDVVDITNVNDILSSTANSHTVYKYTRNNNESYYIEARRRNGRSANIPGEGLIVWQVHKTGSNSTVNTSRPWPQVKVIQANNANSTAQAFVSGIGANAPFRSGGGSNKTSFSESTSPAARYYDGAMSSINISQVSALGNANNDYTMTFRIGSDGTASSSSARSSSSLAASSSSIATYTLTINRMPNNQAGTVTISPSSSSYEIGTVVTVTATPNEGYKFIEWTGASTGATVSVQITMDGNKTLTANFERMYTLTTRLSPLAGGSVSLDPDLPNYANGTVVTATATPNEGYKFIGWTIDIVSEDSVAQITMNANKTIRANFEEKQRYELTVSRIPAEGGEIAIEPSQPSYLEGTVVSVTAVPNEGYEFAKWSGASASANASVQITMDEDKSLEAEFNISSTPILLSKSAFAQVYAQAMDGNILLKNLPGNSGIEVYNLSGKLVHSGNSRNQQTLKIPVQTKGLYLIKISTEAKSSILQIVAQ